MAALSFICSTKFLFLLLVISAIPIGILISLESTAPATHFYQYNGPAWLHECAKWDGVNRRFLVSSIDGGGLSTIAVPDENHSSLLTAVSVVKDVDLSGNGTFGFTIDRERNRVVVAVADVIGNKYSAVAAYDLSTWNRLFLTHLTSSVAVKSLCVLGDIFGPWRSREVSQSNVQGSLSSLLTVSFSIIFLNFFSIWVFKSTSRLNQETHFQFNTQPSSILGIKPLTVVTTVSSTIANLSQTRFARTGNLSEITSFSGLKVPDEKDSSSSKGGNATVIQNNADDSILMAMDFKDKLSEGNFRKEFQSELYTGEAVIAQDQQHIPEISRVSRNVKKHHTLEEEEEKGERNCDVTKGKWVFDEGYPLYTSASCPFIDEGFNCEGNGRLDKDYMKWRWKPQDCEIPRFNATNILESIRGKRLVFVGDSINRNQWESMLCLLMSGIKDPKRVYETHGRRITKEKGNYSFKFMDYGCTVEYYVSHFLVHESKARIGKKRVQTLRIDAVDKGSSRWKGADFLVFNTAHWWSHYKTKSGINYYQEGGQVHPHLDVSTAFQKAMMTWASWVDKYTNPRKTQVIFRSSAPSHFRGGDWNAGGHCKEASKPLNRTSGIEEFEKNNIVGEVIRQMKTPVTLLNITSLSDYRVDGHPSIYGRRQGVKSSSSSGVEDCSHWCLPGVPDIWNQLLYFHMQSKL